jgi:hypothetical protein
MSVAGAVLAILVVTGEAQRPELAATLAAAREVVGAVDSVRVVEAPKVSDTAALLVERQLAATAVVQVTWRDPERLHARLRLHAARTDRWIEREIHFAREDTPQERGRALGFSIASMLPEGDPQLQVASAPPPDEPPAPPHPSGRHALGAAVAASAGLGGPAGGIGLALAGDTFVTERLSVGLNVAARGGRISEVGATLVTGLVGAGAARWWLVPDRDHALGLGARADALLLLHAVSHEGPTGQSEWKSHVLPGADLRVTATWRLTQTVEAVLNAGIEVAFGTVDVTVVAAPPANGSATIPALRAVADLGVRARF